MNEQRMTLPQAAPGEWVELLAVTDEALAARLRHLGIEAGSLIMRLEAAVTLTPVRIRGAFGGGGEATLSGAMAAHLVMHLDDGRMLPLLECAPGDTGHLEGVSGGDGLEHALAVLGVELDGNVRVVRKLPPMEYVCLVRSSKEATARRVRLTESMAASLWGRENGETAQFIAASGRPFEVAELLGEPRDNAILQTLGVTVGSVLTLESVEPAKNLHLALASPVALATKTGLRLFLDEGAAARLLVRQGG